MSKRHVHSDLAQRGFTLLETIIALAAFAIIVTTIAGVFMFEMRLRVTAQAEQDAGIAVANALRAITRALEPTATVLASATVQGRLIASGEQAIAFGAPTIDVNGEIRETRDNLTITFDQSRKIIELAIDPATGSRLPTGKRTIGRNIQAFRLRYPTANPADARSVHVLVIAEARGASGATTTREANTIIVLQNKAP